MPVQCLNLRSQFFIFCFHPHKDGIEPCGKSSQIAEKHEHEDEHEVANATYRSDDDRIGAENMFFLSTRFSLII
jgi:hypothetical protein